MTAEVIQRDQLGVLPKVGQGGQGVVNGARTVVLREAGRWTR